MLSDLSAEPQHWLPGPRSPGWRCPLWWRWLCWSRLMWKPPSTHRPLRQHCPRLPPAASCRPCRGGRSWRGSADCQPGWTLDHIYHRGTVSPLRQDREKSSAEDEKVKAYSSAQCGAPKPHKRLTLCVRTCVNDYMLRQVSHINKRLVAHLALVWSDIVVMPNVIGQLTGLHKPVQRRAYNFKHLKGQFTKFQMKKTNIFSHLVLYSKVQCYCSFFAHPRLGSWVRNLPVSDWLLLAPNNKNCIIYLQLSNHKNT